MTKLEREISSRHSLASLERELSQVNWWVLLAALCAFLMTALLLTKFFIGGFVSVGEMTSEQWLNGLAGVLIALVVTATQYYLYKSDARDFWMIAKIALVVFFAVFTEVNNSMEREGHTVRSRSENSEVYKSTVSAINTAAGAGQNIDLSSPLDSQISAASVIYERCKVNLRAGKEKHCSGDLGKLNALKQSKAAEIEAKKQIAIESQANALKLADKARELSYDESKHFEGIKLLMQIFAISAISAAFWFSLIFILVFEFGYHYIVHYHSALLSVRQRFLRADSSSASNTLHQSAQPIQQSIQKPIQGAITAASPYSTANANKANLGSITSTQAATIPQAVPPSAFNGIGFTAKENRPSSAPVQRNTDTEQTDTEADTEIYQRFVTECKAGAFKGDNSDFTSIQTKEWIAKNTGLSKGKSQSLAKEWLEKAGQAGEFKLNPHWTEGSRANKWSIKK